MTVLIHTDGHEVNNTENEQVSFSHVDYFPKVSNMEHLLSNMEGQELSVEGLKKKRMGQSI